MLRIAICEDDPIQIHALTDLTAEYQRLNPELEIIADNFASGAHLLASLESGRVYNAFFLDILMPGLNGIDLARELRLRGEDAPLVFLTSSSDYALAAFDVDAAKYILKPVRPDKLFPILDKVALSLEGAEKRFLFVATPERMVKVPPSSIVCVESTSRRIQVHLTSGAKMQSKTIRAPFSQMVDVLLRDPRFLHAHKSFVLNMAHVRELTSTSFMMKSGIEVPVPRYKHKEARDAYLNYLSKHGATPAGGK